MKYRHKLTGREVSPAEGTRLATLCADDDNWQPVDKPPPAKSKRRNRKD